ncbi:MAG TPA: hypothetical protein VF680_16790 [Allosphingosinicella sp.]|jgi:hypothetical protein
MKILDQNPKEYFDKIVDAKKEDRPWVLSVVLIFCSFIVAVVSFFVFRAGEEKATARAIKAETMLETQRVLNLTDAKNCPQEVRMAEKARDEFHEARYLLLEQKYLNEQKEFLTKFEQLHRQSINLRNEQQRINKIVRE